MKVTEVPVTHGEYFRTVICGFMSRIVGAHKERAIFNSTEARGKNES